MVSEDGTDAGRSAAQSEERKTETTLTTRIRINIPGSRPIPPVVVRTPVADAESAPEPETPAQGTAVSSGPAGGTVEPPAEPAPPAGEKTSDWFAPRKSGPAKGGQGSGATNGAGTAGGSGAAPAPAAPAAAGGARPGAGRPGGVVGAMSVSGGSRPGGSAKGGTGLPGGATGGPVAPGHGGGTGSFDVTEALTAAGPQGNGSRPGAGTGGGEPSRDDLPYFGGPGGPGGPGGSAGPGGPGSNGFSPSQDFNASNDFNGPGDFGGPNGRGGPQGPAGPTSGPVTGDGPVVPPVNGGPGAFRGPGGPGPGGPGPGGRRGPGGPGGTPGMGPGAGLGPGGGLSDDTAILTPQKPAPEPGTGPYGTPPDNVSGHTVTSGIPVVPPGGAQNAPFESRSETTGSHRKPKLPEPVAQNVPKATPKKKKGRNKLALIGGGVVVLAAGAYGAGLLMNHSDVPKGTTVLGVDIGGGTRDDAVKKLDEAFDDRVNKPLKLSVDGRTVELQPDQAGLQFDMQTTVSNAATSDYNPISVIGSLFGQERVVEPEMPTDEEKLRAELEDVAGGAGSVSEGTVSFKSGKAVAVYGKAGKGVDADKSMTAVEEAYRTQVETGDGGTVTVATTTQKPKITDAEVDRFMKEFAKPAMSANVTIKAPNGASIEFGALSLPKILGAKAVNGKLVETYDLKALKDAYGTTFDGVQVNAATGKRDILPQDVAGALGQALRGTTTAERTVTIDTNPT